MINFNLEWQNNIENLSIKQSENIFKKTMYK